MLIQQIKSEKERVRMEIVFLPQTKNSIASIEAYAHCVLCTHHVRRWLERYGKKVSVKQQQQQWDNSKNEWKKAEKLI